MVQDTKAAETKTEAAQPAKGERTEANGAPAAAAPPQRQQNPYPITIKATLDGDTKVLQCSLMVLYNDVYEAVKGKFPNAYPFVLQLTDGKTLGSTGELQRALAELISQMQKNTEAGAPPRTSLPPLRLKLVKVANESEIPRERPSPAAKTDEDELPQEQFEIEGFVVDFARLFTEVTRVDPGTRAEDVALGADRLSRVLDAALTDDKAQALFEKAAEHFRDATCHSLVQWGNVFNLRAERQGQALVKAGKAIEGKALDAILKEYDECEKKFNEALKYRSDSWEAYGSLGQNEWERMKSKIGFIIPAVTGEATEGAPKEPEEEELIAAAKVALDKLDAKKVGQVAKQMDVVNKLFEKAIGLARAANDKKKAEDAAAEAAAGAAAKKPELSEEQLQMQKLHSPLGNMIVMHGNVLFEWSQVLAAVSKPEWRAILDSATERFTTAGASKTDVRLALKKHSRRDELDLGPDPEPPAAAKAAEAPAKEASKPAPEAAKGLPSLEVKKKPAPAAKA